MADQKRKVEMIRSIENLQLSTHLITGLDNAKQAESIATAIDYLQDFTQHWN